MKGWGGKIQEAECSGKVMSLSLSPCGRGRWGGVAGGCSGGGAKWVEGVGWWGEKLFPPSLPMQAAWSACSLSHAGSGMRVCLPHHLPPKPQKHGGNQIMVVCNTNACAKVPRNP